MQVPSSTLVIAMFDERSAAEAAVRELHEAGFHREQIGLLSSDAAPTPDQTPPADQQATSTAAVAGVMMAGIAGATVGSSPIMPGTGAVVPAAVLGAALIGGGAVIGGVRQALAGAGMAEDEARYYETEFDRGRAIVIVKAAERAVDAQRILKSHGGYGRSKPAEKPRRT